MTQLFQLLQPRLLVLACHTVLSGHISFSSMTRHVLSPLDITVLAPLRHQASSWTILRIPTGIPFGAAMAPSQHCLSSALDLWF